MVGWVIDDGEDFNEWDLDFDGMKPLRENLAETAKLGITEFFRAASVRLSPNSETGKVNLVVSSFDGNLAFSLPEGDWESMFMLFSDHPAVAAIVARKLERMAAELRAESKRGWPHG